MKYGQITTNYHLKKPDREDNVLIQDLNDNADILEKILNELNTKIKTKVNIQDGIMLGSPKAPVNPVEGAHQKIEELAPIATIKNIENELIVTEIIKITDTKSINSNNVDLNALYMMVNTENKPIYYKWLDSDTGLIEVTYDSSTHKFN